MNRCTGHCCRAFTVDMKALSWQYENVLLKRAFDIQLTEHEADIEMIAEMLCEPAKFCHIGFDDVQRFSCKNLNQETGDCMAYAERPKMCWNYPYGGMCEYRECQMESREPFEC